MKATDKQIQYLTDITNRVNRIIESWPECGLEKYAIDWQHERTQGMTTIDASMKIDAFHRLIQGINMKRRLFALPPLKLNRRG